MFRFEKLDVWHKAVDFATKVYSATVGFPVDERFGLTSQMRRAAVSISSNIAEGRFRSFCRDCVWVVVGSRLPGRNCQKAKLLAG
jgi:hypothetical protein